MPPEDAIRRFAEEPDFEQPEPWPPAKLIRGEKFTLMLFPDAERALVSRIRTTASDLDATIAEARALVRENDHTGCFWQIGPSCRPAGLHALLVERGFVPAQPPKFEPRATAMLLTTPPAVTPRPGVEARSVRTSDEYLDALAVALRGYGESEDVVEAWRAAGRLGWDHPNGVARMTHVVFVDGQLAGAGLTSYGQSAILLAGAGVLPKYRGRGAYRALVASRWETAVAAGKPALVIQAGAMSRPILERCGFQVLCQLDVLVDPLVT